MAGRQLLSHRGELPGRSSEAPARTVRAAAFAIISVVLLLALRAKSDGDAPSFTVIALSLVLVTIVARPLTARQRGCSAVVSGLLATEFALHATFLFATTGHFAHAGRVGLLCSPETSTSTGPGCLPTERGGALLLAVQLGAAVIFACWLQRADAMVWQLARQSIRALAGVVLKVASMLATLLAVVLPEPAIVSSPQGNSAPRPPRLLFVRRYGRRGPPCARHHFALSASASPAPCF